MRWYLISPLAKVQFYDSWCVNWIPFVRIHHNAKQSRVGVDEFSLETNLQVVEDRGIIQESQVCHVLALLKLGRVDLANLRGLEGLFLEIKVKRDLEIEQHIIQECFVITSWPHMTTAFVPSLSTNVHSM